MIATALDIEIKRITFVPNWPMIGAAAIVAVAILLIFLLMRKR